MKNTKFFLPLVLVIATFAIYAGSFSADFHFDDYVYILDSPEILDINHCLKVLSSHFFRPDRMLVTLSFAINHQIHNFNLAGYHLFNILIHVLNGLLLYVFLQKLIYNLYNADTRKHAANISFIVSLLFLLHPVAVNSVTYITQRHVLLATFFYLLSIYFYFQARLQVCWTKFFYGLAVLLAFWAAIHSKPMAITAPLSILACEIFLVTKINEKSLKVAIKQATPFLALFIVLMLLYGLKAGLFEVDATLAGFRSELLWSPWQHMMTESIVFLRYWLIILFPLPALLSVDHYFPVIQSFSIVVLLSLFLHGTIITFALLALRSNYLLFAFGVAWFYITLVPPYFALPIKDVMVDYKTYLPSVGVGLILAEVIIVLLRYYKLKKLLLLLVLVAGIFVLFTKQRIQVFESEINLWTDVIKKYPTESRPYNNRGLAYNRAGNYKKAIKDYSEILRINQNYNPVYINIGDSYLGLKDYAKASLYYGEYIKRKPDEIDGFVHMANAYGQQNSWHPAVQFYDQALKIDKNDTEVLYNSGLANAHIGDYEKANYLMHEILKKDHRHYKAITTVGSLYYLAGNKQESIKQFKKALRIEPMYGDALYNLAIVYIEIGNILEAVPLGEQLKEVDLERAKQIDRSIKRKESATEQ